MQRGLRTKGKTGRRRGKRERERRAGATRRITHLSAKARNQLPSISRSTLASSRRLAVAVLAVLVPCDDGRKLG